MSHDETSRRELVTKIVDGVPDADRAAILAWAEDLMLIRDGSESNVVKARSALKATLKSKVAWPIARTIGQAVKRHGWDERGVKSRFFIAGSGVGLALFGSQAAGIAALGGAIGVPLWLVVGGGAVVLRLLIDELRSKNAGRSSYRVIDSEKEE